jgi:hypothetical protein
MDFNPRTATGIPTEPVGSIPRPLKLQQAYAAYDAKKISKAQLEEEQNAAVADTIKRFEATGSPIITDGEQSASRASPPIRLPIRLPELDWRPTWRQEGNILRSLLMAIIASCPRSPAARFTTISTRASWSSRR